MCRSLSVTKTEKKKKNNNNKIKVYKSSQKRLVGQCCPLLFIQRQVIIFQSAGVHCVSVFTTCSPLNIMTDKQTSSQHMLFSLWAFAFFIFPGQARADVVRNVPLALTALFKLAPMQPLALVPLCNSAHLPGSTWGSFLDTHSMDPSVISNKRQPLLLSIFHCRSCLSKVCPGTD